MGGVFFFGKKVLILHWSGERSSPNRDRGVTDFQKNEDLPSKNTTYESLGGGVETPN